MDKIYQYKIEGYIGKNIEFFQRIYNYSLLKIEKYKTELYKINKAKNLTSIPPVEFEKRVIAPAFSMFKVIFYFVKEENLSEIVDIGSGGGLLGIPVSIFLSVSKELGFLEKNPMTVLVERRKMKAAALMLFKAFLRENFKVYEMGVEDYFAGVKRGKRLCIARALRIENKMAHSMKGKIGALLTFTSLDDKVLKLFNFSDVCRLTIDSVEIWMHVV